MNEHKCKFCGAEAHYQTKGGSWICMPIWNKCPEVRKKFANKRIGNKPIRDYKAAYQNLPQETKDRMNWAKGKTSIEDPRIHEIDVETRINQLNNGELPNIQTFKLKNWLIKHGIKENKCEICGCSEWNGKPIICQLHHKDGNKHNNALDNLQMLCPNCHSQTETFTAKNYRRYKKYNINDDLSNAPLA